MGLDVKDAEDGMKFSVALVVIIDVVLTKTMLEFAVLNFGGKKVVLNRKTCPLYDVYK